MSNHPQSAGTMSADGKLAHVQELLGRMQELAEQVTSGKCTPEQCAEFQTKLVGLRAEIERITGSPM